MHELLALTLTLLARAANPSPNPAPNPNPDPNPDPDPGQVHELLGGEATGKLLTQLGKLFTGYNHG